MDTMNQGAGMGSAPMGTPMNSPKKKSSLGLIIVLIIVAAVIALLVFSQDKMDTTDTTMEETATYDGQTEPVNSNSDDLDDLEADVNSLNFDDIDAGFK